MKISVLSHDMSHNCLGRAWVIANLVADRHDVEIVGPVLGNDVWEPLRHDTSVAYRPLDRCAPSRDVLSALDGDLLYAVKPKGTSLGRALKARRARPRPIVADIDDWEMAFYLDDLPWLVKSAARVWDPTNLWVTAAMERAVAKADGVTVSSTFLQRRFGGDVLRHARDPLALDPGRTDGSAVRREHQLGNHKVVLFLGSPRPHKGVGTVLRAIDELADPYVIFLVVGVSDPSLLPDRPDVVVLPPQPFDQLPSFLAAADVVVLAQHRTRTAQAQVPAKVFDAMAMAKPVITTDLSDLPEILGGGGLVVDPGDATQLAEALRWILGNGRRARAMGELGRNRFLEHYSFDAVRPVVHRIVDRALIASRSHQGVGR